MDNIHQYPFFEMTGELFVQLAKIQFFIFVMIKVAVLLKFFLFLKFRSTIWKPIQFIYFPVNQIGSHFSQSSVKVIKTQNILTIFLVVLNVGLVLVRSIM